jgi:OOP family OmpA-OmpF porin
MKKAMAGLCVAATLVSISGAALASYSGFYVLGAVGQTRTDTKSETDADLIALGVTGLASSGDDNATAYKLQVGYQINQNLAVEGGYVDGGKFSYNATATAPNTPITANAKATGWNLVAVGILPLDNQFSALGKIGIADVRTSATATIAGVSASGSASKTDLAYGLGAKYDVTNAVFLRGDWDSYKPDSGKRSNVWTVGVGYKF